MKFDDNWSRGKDGVDFVNRMAVGLGNTHLVSGNDLLFWPNI
jgi:hypothetical protein